MSEIIAALKRHLTGRSLIGLTFLGLLLLFSALGLIAMDVADIMETEFRTVFEEKSQRLRYLDKMLLISRDRQIELRNVVLLQDPFDRDDASIRYSDLADTFIPIRDQYLELVTSERGKKFIEELQAQLRKIFQQQQRVIEAALDEQSKEAEGLLQLVIPEMVIANRMMQAQLVKEQLAVQASYQNAQDEIFRSRWYILVLFTTALGVGGLAMLLVLRQHSAHQKTLQRLAAIAEHSPEIVLTLNSRGDPIYANPPAYRLFEDANAVNLVALLPRDIADIVTRCLATHHAVSNMEHAFGDHRWIISIQPVAWQPLVHCFFTDITNFSRIEEEKLQERELSHVTLRAISDSVITTNAEGKINFINQSAADLIGLDAQAKTGLALGEVFATVSEATRATLEDPSLACLRDGETIELPDTSLLLVGDKEIPITQAISPIRAADGHIIGTVLVFHDVSQERNLRYQLSYQASHDALTGLVNRREMEARIESALFDSRSRKISHALLYMDLDQFKIVNDTCGHVAGDELLRQLSVVLQEQGQLRDTDTLSRLGGDEFGILLLNCSMENAEAIAERVRKVVKEFRFGWENISFEIGVSIGVVAINEFTQNIASVMSAADIACYAAKDGGRNRVHVYKTDDTESVRRHTEIQLVTEIRTAIAQDRFFLEYQRIDRLDGDGGEELHYEVLIRMRDENDKVVPPNAFIPAAERYDIMTSVDRWVVEHVLSSYHGLAESVPGRLLKFSINLSGQSLGDDTCLGYITELLEQYSIPRGVICFEVTETAAVANLGKAITFIKALKEVGCSFSLDDFGSGLSSFAYLKNLPVDYLKIDGTFVADILDDPIDLAMVEAINQIGKVMGLKTIAESAENAAIIDKLRSVGVDYVQGYGVDRPKPLHEAFPQLKSGTG